MGLIEKFVLGVVLFFLLLMAVPAIAIKISELALFTLFWVVLFNIGKPR
jgi:uncharacterized membrane protein